MTPDESARVTAVVKALIAEHGSAVKLAEAMTAAGFSISQPVLSAQARGEPGGYHLAKQLAAFRRIGVEELLSGVRPKDGPRWRELPGWKEEEAKARTMFPRVRPLAFARLGNLMGERPPSVAALTIRLLATTWDQCSTDDERIAAIAENADREMEEEDAAAEVAIRKRHEARERGEPLPPLPGEPAAPAKKSPKPKANRTKR